MILTILMFQFMIFGQTNMMIFLFLFKQKRKAVGTAALPDNLMIDRIHGDDRLIKLVSLKLVLLSTPFEDRISLILIFLSVPAT